MFNCPFNVIFCSSYKFEILTEEGSCVNFGCYYLMLYFFLLQPFWNTAVKCSFV